MNDKHVVACLKGITLLYIRRNKRIRLAMQKFLQWIGKEKVQLQVLNINIICRRISNCFITSSYSNFLAFLYIRPLLPDTIIITTTVVISLSLYLSILIYLYYN